MIRRIEARDKGPVLGLIRATGFFTAAEVGVAVVEGEVARRDGRAIIIETSSQPKYHGTRQFSFDLGYKEVARVPDFCRAGDDRVIYAKYFR